MTIASLLYKHLEMSPHDDQKPAVITSTLDRIKHLLKEGNTVILRDGDSGPLYEALKWRVPDIAHLVPPFYCSLTVHKSCVIFSTAFAPREPESKGS